MKIKPDNRFAMLGEQPADFFKLIPQTGVEHIMAKEWPTHNAIWDMAVSPEKTIFFSICGESYVAEYARLYEYNPKTKEMKLHFKLEDKLIHQENSLRTSKFHTAISFMGDGKLITTTHTTSPSPLHPVWMPFEYANHQWEGFQGSNILVYNYKTGDVDLRGVISPFDTTYGGTYSPESGDYFCTTWMMGTGYVYNEKTGEHRCLGQVSDVATSRTFLFSDGHIYGSTYSGRMFRYNKDKRDIEYLEADLGALMRHAVEYNGIIYITTGPCAVPGRGQELFSYNLETGELKKLGRPVPKINYTGERNDVFMNAYGMAIDSKGRLWYGCQTYLPTMTYCGDRLYMWDIQNGKDPVDFGFMGTKERTLSISAEMRIVDDVLYISDGNHVNHEESYSGLMVIDLEKFEEAAKTEERIFSHDYMNYMPYPLSCSKYYPKDDFDEKWNLYNNYYEKICDIKAFQADNWFRKKDTEIFGISFWETVGRENTSVRHIEWNSDDSLFIYTSGEKSFAVNAVKNENGKFAAESIKECDMPEFSEIKAEIPTGISLPFVPGKKYLSVPEASVAMADGTIIAGTKDMMLAKIKDNKVYSLGGVCTCGGVHSLCATPDGNKVYGVAGYPRGIGNWFSYDNENGIELLGYIPDVFAENGRNVCILHPTTLAISPSGKYVAIGGSDELAGVVIIEL